MCAVASPVDARRIAIDGHDIAHASSKLLSEETLSAANVKGRCRFRWNGFKDDSLVVQVVIPAAR
jgi:hypothetical protein